MSIKINSITKNLINTANNSKIVAFKSNPMPNDTIELSTKKELSNTSKVGIGIGIATIIGLGLEVSLGKCKHLKSLWKRISGKGVNGTNSANEGKKYLDKIDDIKENFSKIFGRDYTKDEAQELALKYKEIFEINDNETFITKLLEKVKEDYKLSNMEIPWKIENWTENYVPAIFSIFDGITYNKNTMMLRHKKIQEAKGIKKIFALFSHIDKDFYIKHIDKKRFVDVTTHELKHAEQYKIALGVDLQKVIESESEVSQKEWKRILKKHKNDEIKAKEYLTNNMKKDILPSYLSVEKISNDSPLYQRGLKLIESFDTRGNVEYQNQMHEIEAMSAGNRMAEIYEWLMNK